jgi:hypothetical protein
MKTLPPKMLPVRTSFATKELVQQKGSTQSQSSLLSEHEKIAIMEKVKLYKMQMKNQ